MKTRIVTTEDQPAPKFEKIGLRIQWIRKYRSQTAYELAEQCGVDQSSWSKYELGKRKIPVDAAVELANKARVTIEFIYRGKVAGLPEVWKSRLLDDREANGLVEPTDTAPSTDTDKP